MMSLVVDIKKDFGRFRLDVEFEAGIGEVTGCWEHRAAARA